MNKVKVIMVLFLVTAVSMVFGGCTSKDEEEIHHEEGMYIQASFESDSDNGLEWILTQEPECFDVESFFMEDESHEGEGSGEEEMFYLKPLKEGDVVLTFSYKDEAGKEAKYTYNCSIDSDLNVTLGESIGEYDGQPVEAPEIYVSVE